MSLRKDGYTDVAWLSSARVVRCWVKSRNERNPCSVLPASYVGDSQRTAGDKPEEGGDDVKSAWLLRPGLHTRYNGEYKEMPPSDRERTSKSFPQFRLHSETRVHEVGVASNRVTA